MPKNTKILSNRQAFNRAVDNVEWKLNRGLAYTSSLPTLQDIDVRNITDLACLFIDVDGLEGEERENYFLSEIEQIKDAFYTLDPETNRPYPERLIPYFSRLYNTMDESLDIDWDDRAQIEHVLGTMKALQTLATFALDFKDAAFALYPTQEAVKLLDAHESKAFLVYNNMRMALSDAEIFVGSRTKTGEGCYNHPVFTIQRDVNGALYDATIEGKNGVNLDPKSSDLFKKFLFNENFDTTYQEGGIYEDEDGIQDMRADSPYNQDDYYKDFLNIVCKTYSNTTFENMLVQALTDKSDRKYKRFDLLHIDGKSLHDIIKEKCAEGLDEDSAQIEAGKALRDALVDGHSVVTLMRATLNKEGKVDFFHQEINVDLDKANAIDRKQNYGFFRNILHKIGIWKIPEKFPSNGARDKNQALVKADSQYTARLEAAEDKFVSTYNSLEAPSSACKDIKWSMPIIEKKAVAVPVGEIGNVRIENNPDRQPIKDMNIDKEIEKMSLVPPVKEDDKVPVRDMNNLTK